MSPPTTAPRTLDNTARAWPMRIDEIAALRETLKQGFAPGSHEGRCLLAALDARDAEIAELKVDLAEAASDAGWDGS